MKKVLLAENDFVVATDLACELEARDVMIAGITCSLAGALKAIEDNELDLAVLGVKLQGGLSYPAAKRLGTLGIPFVFLTSFDEVEISPEYRDAPRILKPQDPKKIAELIVGLASTPTVASHPYPRTGSAPV